MKDNSISFRWWGHSCFQVTYQDYSIVFDPYQMGSVPGYPPLHLIANEVHCSHDHADHNGVSQVQIQPGTNPWQMQYIDTFHDHHQGAHRGLSDITFVELPDLTIAHLGDLGRLPTKEEYDKLAKADVVLLPCAGYFTISSKEAAEVIDHLKHPCLKILMHFREGRRGYDVQESINDVMKDLKGVKRLSTSTITVDNANIQDEIITLEPKQ